jgi:hypothetical protein
MRQQHFIRETGLPILWYYVHGGHTLNLHNIAAKRHFNAASWLAPNGNVKVTNWERPKEI